MMFEKFSAFKTYLIEAEQSQDWLLYMQNMGVCSSMAILAGTNESTTG